MKPLILMTVFVAALVGGELLQNKGMESLAHWSCWGFHCNLTSDRHSGQHAMQVTNRRHNYDGPIQVLNVKPGQAYMAEGFMKLLNDKPGSEGGQKVQLEIIFTFPDGSRVFRPAAELIDVRKKDGWVQLRGTFDVPNTQIRETTIHPQGPDPSVGFIADELSVYELQLPDDWRTTTDMVINQTRKSNIHLQVTTASNINKADVQIHVLQTRKSFPFGTAVKALQYNDPAMHKYRDFIHKHFNWAVPGIALKWPQLEKQRGHTNYQPALDMIHGLRRHGLKVRGHNLVWSKVNRIQPWVQQLHGTELRNVVQHHIEETMNVTRGLLEHWDVNNENLHGTWYQDRLHDPDYNLEIFRIAHHADPNVKLFLNEFGVVANGQTTYAYLDQARHFKAAHVGLYGIGVQCHFGSEQEPIPALIKKRLDLLATAGLPLWATELDVMVTDENKRADYYEKALRALYGHPAIEGVLFWGFWDQAHWRGEKAALVKGDNLELTAAGRRVLDLYENQWMTDETHALGQAGSNFTVRGFHGDYEIHVLYKGHELANLKRTFRLDKDDATISTSVHT